MELNMKRAKLNGKMYDVMSLEEYLGNISAYNPSFTAIETEEMIYPVNNQFTTNSVGINIGNTISYVVKPEDDKKQEYSSNSETVIDFSNTNNMKELIIKQAAIKNLEREILTSPDNLFKPKIHEDDAPEMVGMKQAIDLKDMDLDKYEPRFGSNYNNDKRLFDEKKKTLSLNMIKRLCKNLDIKATLLLEDANPNVPNPMREVVSVDLTGGNDIDG